MLVEKKITCIKCPRPLLYSPHKKHVDTLHLRSESNHTSPMAACWAGSSISHCRPCPLACTFDQKLTSRNEIYFHKVSCTNTQEGKPKVKNYCTKRH